MWTETTHLPRPVDETNIHHTDRGMNLLLQIEKSPLEG